MISTVFMKFLKGNYLKILNALLYLCEFFVEGTRMLFCLSLVNQCYTVNIGSEIYVS